MMDGTGPWPDILAQRAARVLGFRAMEGHDAKRPVRSVKDVLVEIVMITVGVLIALSFDGIRTWNEHRELVREARANIASELGDNRTELAGELSGMAKTIDRIQHALDVVDRVVKTKSTQDNSVDLGFGLANLQNASRTTAEVTGALALMDYEEVKRYSSVYALQAEFLRMQSETAAQITRAISLVKVFAEPETATAREIDELTSYLRLAGASLYTQNQIGEGLLKAYDSALGTRRE